jgi:hypothetical protein
LINVTISGNHGAVNAGGIADWASVWGAAPTELRNTVVAANTGPALMDIYSYGLVSRGNNLVGTGPIYGLAHGVNGDIVGTYDAPVAPGLGPLGSNGGSTATQSLSSDSPAIGSGNNCVTLPPENGGCLGEALTSDQRGQGFPRKIGAYVDIGAFESDSVPQDRARYDFDGDGRSDVSVFRPLSQAWYIDRSTQGFSAVRFGLANDKLVPADYDGDGKTDISIFRDGTWWRINSGNNTVEAITFGVAGDFPVPADYTGDGRDDLAVYRSGQWWTLDLSNGQTSVVNFGLSTDKPVPADYDGDGRADQAVYRGGEWHLNRSSQGYAVYQFGIPTDSPVVGDYDGDGKSDLAVYRNGTWYIDYSAHGPSAFQWGIATDIPAPADYDGDGKTDAAIFRDGTWWLRRSTSGTEVVPFGLEGDKPIPSAFSP